MMQFFLTIFLCIDFTQSLVLIDFEGKAEGWCWVEKCSVENVFKSIHITEPTLWKVLGVRWYLSPKPDGQTQELVEQISTLWL